MTNWLALGRFSALLGGTAAVALMSSRAVAQEAALVIDSDQDVTLEETIDRSGEDFGDGVTGVRIEGAITFRLDQQAAINLGNPALEPGDDFSPPDFADNRSGIVVGSGAPRGSILVGSNAEIAVDGDASNGILIEGAFAVAPGADGETPSPVLDVIGGIGIRGADSVGIAVAAPITGDVLIRDDALILVNGSGSDGVRLTSPVDGAVTVNGRIDVSGFSVPNPLPEEDNPDNRALNDVQRGLVSGNGLVVGNDVTGGVLIDPSGQIEDQIRVVGTGNALLVEGIGGPAQLGAVPPFLQTDTDEEGNPTEELVDQEEGTFGIINRGGLTAVGLFSELDTEAVRLQNAVLDGGFANSGVIRASASDAVARAVALGAGLDAPVFYNRNTIGATANTAATDQTGLSTEAVAVDVFAGAQTSMIENRGNIFASSQGGNATAIRDRSGVLTDIVNSGLIEARTTADAATVRGRPLAIDLSANTSGVDIDNSGGAIIGEVVLGSGADRFRADSGVALADMQFGAGDDIVELTNGADIIGSVDFGTGGAALAASGGSRIVADVTFGGGTNTFTLTDGAAFEGTIANTGALAIDVDNASLTLQQATTGVDSLAVSNGGELGITVGADGVIASIDTGSATFAEGTVIRPIFRGAFSGSRTQRIVTADALTIGGDVGALLGTENLFPVLFDPSLTRDGNDILLTLTQKDAAEIGVRAGAGAALDPAIRSLSGDDSVGTTLFNATTAEEFTDVFDQLLPQPLDAAISYAQQQNSIVTSYVAQRTEVLPDANEGRPGTAWLQQQAYFLDRSADADSNGFDGGGFVVAAGIDRTLGPIDVFGMAAHFASARYDEQTGEDFPFNRTAFGLDVYAAERVGSVVIDGRAGYAWTSSDSERNVVAGGQAEAIRAEWDGSQLAANGRLRYLWSAGRTRVEPFVALDFLNIQDDAYVEDGESTLALSVDETDASSLRGSVGVAISRTFESQPTAYSSGIPATIEPRLTAAYGHEFITDDLETSAAFLAAASDDGSFAAEDRFLLTAEPESNVAVVGADLLYENAYAKIIAGGTVQVGENVNAIGARVSIGLKW